MVAREALVLAPAGWVCRRFGIEFYGSMRRVQSVWWTARRPGQVPRLDRAQRGELAQLVEGPILGVHRVVRWQLSDLAAWVIEKYRTSISEQTLSRYLREMGYRKLSARPRHHAQIREAVAAFKKSSLSAGQRSRRVMHQASR
jgi:hypothetical protein